MNSDQAQRLARLHLDISHALYQERERVGISVETVAERTGLAPDRIVMIEEGDTTSLTEVAQMCEAIGVSLVTLFSEAVDHTRQNESVARIA